MYKLELVLWIIPDVIMTFTIFLNWLWSASCMTLCNFKYECWENKFCIHSYLCCELAQMWSSAAVFDRSNWKSECWKDECFANPYSCCNLALVWSSQMVFSSLNFYDAVAMTSRNWQYGAWKFEYCTKPHLGCELAQTGCKLH